MNEPLITKHGAASLLGITKAALMKLVKADQVPYVRLPGNGDVRFDGSDLQKFVNSHKGGNMPATATRSERQAKQEHLRKRPEYAEQLKQVRAKLDALQIKVDAGELTEKALEQTQLKWNHLSSLIGKIDNGYRTDLKNSCPCEDLHDEWEEFNEQFKTVDHERTRVRQQLERQEQNLHFEKKAYNSLINPGNKGVATYEFKPFTSDAEYQARIDKKERDVKKLKKDIEKSEKRIAELTEQIETIQSEKLRVREEMIHYQEN